MTQLSLRCLHFLLGFIQHSLSFIQHYGAKKLHNLTQYSLISMQHCLSFTQLSLTNMQQYIAKNEIQQHTISTPGFTRL